MGQGKSSNQSSSISYTKDGRYLHKQLEAIKKPFEVVDPLIPNGLFPPEILELILMHLDPPSLAKVIISCKLWLQTSNQVFQHTYRHRYILPPNTDLSTFNAREEVFKQHLIEQQMTKGNCWIQELSQNYSSGRSRTSFQHKWSHYGNIIALTKEKVHHSSYGSSTSLDQTWLIDMGANGAEKQDVYGVHLVGGVRVVPKATQFSDWNWEEVRCFINEEDSFIITRKNKFVRKDLDDPWHSLRSPARMMDGLANLDESAQLLIYDRNTANRSGLDTFIIEVWNVTNGDLIHEIKLDAVGDNVIGFYKHYAIMSLKATEETVFVNLTSGLVEKSFPQYSTRYSFCLFDNKMAFISESEVSVYDYETTDLIKKINVDIFKANQKFKFTGVSLDKWKLVVSTKPVTKKAGYYEVSSGFVAIFDMTRDFTLLCTKFIASLAVDDVTIACLPNGSIVVGDIALLVLDFLHPYLEKPMSVVVFTGSPTVQVEKINPLDLGKFASEKLKCELGELSAISYYEVPDGRPATDHYAWERGYEHLNSKFSRITFISPAAHRSSLAESKKQLEKTITPTFLKYWRKHTDTVAPFSFTSNDVNEKPSDHQDYERRSSAFSGASIMVFEKFNQKSKRWEITEPVVPKGINVEIEFDV